MQAVTKYKKISVWQKFWHMTHVVLIFWLLPDMEVGIHRFAFQCQTQWRFWEIGAGWIIHFILWKSWWISWNIKNLKKKKFSYWIVFEFLTRGHTRCRLHCQLGRTLADQTSWEQIIWCIELKIEWQKFDWNLKLNWNWEGARLEIRRTRNKLFYFSFSLLLDENSHLGSRVR